MTNRQFAVFFLSLCGFAILAASAVVWRASLEMVCIDNGYADCKTVGFSDYCIGVRGGDTVVVPLEDLKTERNGKRE